ncbi:hypothetical protein F2Q68_00025119 [Brassica cretica]|uniref:Uncharacterized protein n=3 Tax=Brassica cretica TaxID=69181 RepID=A0A3N6U960_BRACR|nr:hypothetical protein F2Q68_00025119 [Brassica cretica]KAF3581243.1 hypothetical protein DY000_02030571 [Brassica cretica]
MEGILKTVGAKSGEAIIARSREENSALKIVDNKRCRFQTCNQPMQPLDDPAVGGTMIRRAPPMKWRMDGRNHYHGPVQKRITI